MREKGIHTIEVHVAGLCFAKRDGEWQCLIGHRAPTRKLYPDLWECGGGQVRTGETFPDAIKRQMREEFGIDIQIEDVLCAYHIPLEDGVIPGIKFICSLTREAPIQIDGEEIVEYAWIKESEVGNYAFIDGVKQDILDGFCKVSSFKKSFCCNRSLQ